MSENNEGIDNLLLLLTQRSGGIEKLLENFFTFLARKTDFYKHPDKSTDSSLDHCVNLVSYYCRNVGMKYSELISKNVASKKSAPASASPLQPNARPAMARSTSLTGPDKEVPKESTRSEPRSSKSAFFPEESQSSRDSDSFRFESSRSESSRSETFNFESRLSPESKASADFSEKNKPSVEFSEKNNGSTEDSKKGVESREDLKKKVKSVDLDKGKESDVDLDENMESEEESSPPPGNGGKTEWYEWTQTLSSLELLVKLPEGTLSKNVKVDIGTNRLSVKVNNTLLFHGELYDSVKSDECLWALLDGKLLQISLEKRNQMNWWATVVKGHPEIDVKKIVPENSKLSDLDPEMRSTVEKMMFDQRQKAQGLPTSSQTSQYEALEKFKKAHPELDFSKANINFS